MEVVKIAESRIEFIRNPFMAEATLLYAEMTEVI